MEEKRIRINGEDSNYIVREDGTIINTKFNHILKGTLQRNEYHTVYLIHNGKQYNYMTHRLVAEYFCENPNGYTVVHHKDGNPHNNAASNLQWVSTEINNATENRRTPAKKRMAEKVEELNLDEWTPVLDGGIGVLHRGGKVHCENLRRVVVEGHGGHVAGVHGPPELVPADDRQGVGQNGHHVGVLLDVLRDGAAHEAPPADVFHPGDVGEKGVGHRESLQNLWILRRGCDRLKKRLYAPCCVKLQNIIPEQEEKEKNFRGVSLWFLPSTP